jgi:hypothetical protein
MPALAIGARRVLVGIDLHQRGNQRRELEAVAARSGWEAVGIYEDAGISGSIDTSGPKPL